MPARRSLVLVLIFFGVVISYIDRGNLSIAAVEIMREFHFPAALMGTLLSCFFWTYAVSQIPAGLIVDKVGIRRAYGVAFLVWCGASASVAFSHGFASLMGLRLVLGVAEAIAPLASLSFIRRSYAPAAQGFPTSLYISGQMLGPAAGAWLGTMLLQSFGWRAMFAVTGLAALVWLAPWLMFAPDELPAVEGRPAGGASRPPVGQILGSAGFWALTAAIFLLSYFWYFLLTWVPSYLRLAHGFSALEMGRIMGMSLAAMAVSTLAGGVAADPLARRSGAPVKVRLLFTAIGLMGAGFVLLLQVVPDRSWVLPVLFVAVCFSGVGNASFWALVQLAAPAGLIGRAVGYLNTLSQLAGVAAPLVTGWLLGPSNRFGAALIIAGICPVAAGLVLLAAGAGRVAKLRALLE